MKTQGGNKRLHHHNNIIHRLPLLKEGLPVDVVLAHSSCLPCKIGTLDIYMYIGRG